MCVLFSFIVSPILFVVFQGKKLLFVGVPCVTPKERSWLCLVLTLPIVWNFVLRGDMATSLIIGTLVHSTYYLPIDNVVTGNLVHLLFEIQYTHCSFSIVFGPG